MCDALVVSHTQRLQRLTWPPGESPRAAENRALLAGVLRVHASHRGRYGAPHFHAAYATRDAAKRDSLAYITIGSGSTLPSGTSPPNRQSSGTL